MNRILLIVVLTVLITVYSFPQNESTDKTLLIRCDDIGMSHGVNQAAKELIDAGLKFSASVMVPCSWFDEAVDILKDNPQISVGIHLTLNSEWKNYRWGPVAGVSAVPSLVDSVGYFFPSRASFFANNPKLDEVELELRAQIEKAIKAGLKISYLDYHMGTAVDNMEMRKIVEKLATEYDLAISRYFGEVDIESMYSIDIEEKENHLLKTLDELKEDQLNLLVCHIAKDNDEMKAMIDLNPFGLKEMSRHREAELNALLSSVRNDEFRKRGITLINYDDLIKEKGLESMKSPVDSGY
ncbi:MAG: polysaccharide deacetylase family protein [Ignavibacterium sp.]|nr:polysaccharide deacetylase family protein [Ignavibacterium sp.]